MADEAEGQGADSGSGAMGSATEEASSNLSCTERNESEVKMRINFRVPSYTAFLDDGSRVELEAKDHVVELNDVEKSPWKTRKNRFKAAHEPGAKKQQRCNKCEEFGHRETAAHEPGAKKQQRCNKCGEFGHRETGNCPLNDLKKRRRKPQQKKKPKRPKTIPANTILPGSLT